MVGLLRDVPTQTYYLKQEGVFYDEKTGAWRVQPTLWKRSWKNIFEKTWIPKEKATSVKTFIGESGKIQVDFPTSRNLTGGDIELTGVVEGKVVRWGHSWFKHIYISSKMQKIIDVGKPVSQYDYGFGYGSYKRGGIVDVYKDIGIQKQRYSLFGEMIEKGYTVDRPIITGFKGTQIQQYGSYIEYFPGFGSRYHPAGQLPKPGKY